MKASIISILILVIACSPGKETKVDVSHYGALRMVMHHGDISVKASLDTISQPGVYAVGALDSLKGEIFIENGNPLISIVDSGNIKVRPTANDFATLLVTAKVNSWDTINVAAGDIEAILAEKAANYKVATPFPFVILGSFPRLKYHVINLDLDKGDVANHKEGAYKGDLSNKQVTIVGFYSDKHHGIFTHHDSNVHLHVRDENSTEMGHVDVIESGNKSFTLLLPKS